MTRNAFEAEARAAKALALIATIDEMNASRDAAAALEWARRLTTKQWIELAIVSGVRPPSPTTQAQILALLERRVRVAAIARAS